MSHAVLVTCEHGGYHVPGPWEELFRGEEELLASHRGWDPGAAELARALAARLGAPVRVNSVSRLLADTNRSEDHPRVFGEPVRRLAREERARIVEAFHRPHRAAVEEDVGGVVAAGRTVLHLAVHSFTPVLDGRRRETGIGLLYDPARDPERELAARWARRLREALPEMKIHRNRPYRGVSDGLPTRLRQRFGPDAYAGFEVEVRSDLLVGAEADPSGLAGVLAETLGQAVVASGDTLPGVPAASRAAVR